MESMMSYRKLGILIREARKAKGISQMELAEKLDISYIQLQKYEYGTANISINRLVQIAEALNVPINTFFLDESNGDLLLDNEEKRLLRLLRMIESPAVMKDIIETIKAKAKE